MKLDPRKLSFPAFIGAKTLRPIPSGTVPADFLVQTSLDPSVTEIDYLDTVQLGRHVLDVDAVVLTTISGRTLLQVEGGSLRDLDETGNRLLVQDQTGMGCREVSLSDINAEPRRGNARNVWRCRHVAIEVSSWRTISAELAVRSAVPLGDLLSSSGAQMEAIYGLACRNHLALDISARGLTLDTMVRSIPDIGVRNASDYSIDGGMR